jgi:5-amino-6-(5-phosphoribosylamino)uracil reductase
MFHALRERVDALLAGTQTLRTERYGRPIRDPEARERRAQRGLAPEPLACVITRSGELPTDIPLFTEPDVRVIVFTSVWIDRLPEHIEIVQLDPGEMTLLTVMRRLRVEHDVSSLLCEGGPTLFGSLLDEGLVDELFLTISPTLAGGGMEPTISRGMGLAEPATMSLRWALEREQSLFLRYSVFTNSE